ncbi:radical SAM protein [Synechococcus sp. PCC 7335]|uniref:radical SAM/SPASM domain-containing protein n=1 Tax=Synechococcus sp. (strain ATCC 29403 / PCC 7335) TaxID=91464 RepID=UPI0018DD05E9|nr:radical SAM protein [Synechococcus sp. PCC 7335]
MNADSGSLHVLSTEMAERVRSLRQSPSTVVDEDITLAALGVVVLDPAERQKEINEELELNWSRNAVLTVLPTEQCNFRCTYCYETFEKGRMSSALQLGLHKFLRQQVPMYESFQLAWFGGEPLVETEVIAQATAIFHQARNAHRVRGTASITTNGYLLSGSRLERLDTAGIDVYQITLDGDPAVHDSQRITASGHKTHHQIMENIKGVLTNTLARVVVRINVDTHKDEAAKRTACWVRNELADLVTMGGERVDIAVVPVWSADTTTIDGICLSSAHRFQVLNMVKEAACEIKGTTTVEKFLQLSSALGTLSCYAGKPNTWVVGSDGTVYKCTVAFDLPENKIGRLTESGNMELDIEKAALWTQKNATNDPTCGKCAFARSCQGIFCPLLRMQVEKPPCPTEKRLFDLAVASEVNSYVK